MVVKITDGSGQQNAGSCEVGAAKDDLVLLVATDRSVATPGKPFQATPKGLDLDGNQLKAVPITLRYLGGKEFPCGSLESCSA